jgi:hypothetical protein
MPIYFDTEAGQFQTHLVSISGVWHISEELSKEQFVQLSTREPIEHICQWKIDNIKLNFAVMAKIGQCKSQWQLQMFELPIHNSSLPQTHKSDRIFFKKYWKLDKTSYEKFMKNYFPGWLKDK